MLTNEFLNATLLALKYTMLFLIPFVEPQLAGILGGIAYLIVRHELHMADLTFKNVLIVMFFGWLGAWATVHIIDVHCIGCPHVWEHLISATVGFLSYDALMAAGANTKSVIGFLVVLLKKGADKWKF